jgi:hypothetical protein
MLMVGLPVVAVLSLGLGALHVTAVAAAPLLALVHLVVTRVYLMREPRRLLGRVRQRFLRWLSRLGFLWVGVPGYAAAATPLVGVLAGLGTYAGLTSAAWAYTSWGLYRERDRDPLAAWERWLLRVLVALTLVLMVALLAVAAAVGWSISALLAE